MNTLNVAAPPIPDCATATCCSRREILWGLAVFLFATLWAMAYLKHAGFFHYTAFAEQADIAEHIARGHGFLSPLDHSANAPPTSWAGPVYPYLMASVYLLLGIKTPAALAMLIGLNAVFVGAIAAGVYTLGRMILDRRAGLIAVGLLCLHPAFLRLAGYYWDTYLAMTMFVWLTVGVLRLGSKPLSWRSAASLGASFGIFLLTNPSYIGAAAVMGILALRRTPGAKRIARAAVIAVAFLIVMFPWTLRNYLTFGKVFYVRAGPALELWVGNQPTQPGFQYETSAHPSANPIERKMLLQMGEIRYFAFCKERFLALYHSDPAAYWERVRRRIIYEFLSDPSYEEDYPLMQHGPEIDGMMLSYILLHGLVATFGLAGYWMMVRLRRAVSWQPLIVGIAATAPFVFVHVIDRYMLPLRVMLLVGAGAMFGALIVRLRTGQWPNERNCGWWVVLKQFSKGSDHF